jgi:hypothetical protein
LKQPNQEDLIRGFCQEPSNPPPAFEEPGRPSKLPKISKQEFDQGGSGLSALSTVEGGKIFFFSS